MPTLQEKLAELGKQRFSEQACYEFFGKLTENEIRLFREKLSSEAFSFLLPEQRSFIQNYLELLLEKIEEKKGV
jgi:hypothetical protein